MGFRHVLDRQQNVGFFAGLGVVALDPRAIASTPSSKPRKRLRPCDGTSISILARDWHSARSRSSAPADGRYRATKFPADRRGRPDRPIEHRRERARRGFAVLEQHGAIGLLRHDLHGAAVAAGNSHAHQPVAEAASTGSASAATGPSVPVRRSGAARCPVAFGRHRSSGLSATYCSTCNFCPGPFQVTKRAGPGGPTLKSRF